MWDRDENRSYPGRPCVSCAHYRGAVKAGHPGLMHVESMRQWVGYTCHAPCPVTGARTAIMADLMRCEIMNCGPEGALFAPGAAPPRGPVRFADDGRYCLTQRTLAAHSGWHLLVGCLMQNLTDRCQARPALERLFEIVPNPEHAAGLLEDQPGLREALEPCGLFNKRVVAIREMSQDFLDPSKRRPIDLRYCGQYARDSWDIFVAGVRLHPEDATDHELKPYLEEMWNGPWAEGAEDR